MHEIQDPVDKTFSVCGPEWHNKADHVSVIDDTVLEPIFFNVVQRPLLSEVDGITYTIPNYKTLWADFRHRTDFGDHPQMVNLHVAKESYKPILNRDVWEMAKRAVEGLDCEVSSAGTLGGGKYFYITIVIKGEEEFTIKGDRFKGYFNIITSHNGTMALEAYDSLIRIVCMNTLRWSRSSKGEIDFKVYHTSNCDIAISNMGDILNQILQGRKEFVNQMEYLMSRSCNFAQAMNLVAGWIGEGSRGFKISSQIKNRIDDIALLFSKGKGNAGKSLYDLLNGATEYWTSGNGTGKKSKVIDKWAKSEFGTAADKKRDFVNFLMGSDEFLNDRARYGAELLREWQLNQK